MEYLIVSVEKSSPVAFPLTKDTILVGRDSLCDIFLSHTSISREHARLYRRGDDLWLTDNNSMNGTFLNDKQISKTVKVKAGDEIRFGSVLTRIDTAPQCRTTITKSLAWADVDEAGRLGLPEGDRIAPLALLVRITEALDDVANEESLLSRFAAILKQYIGSTQTGFFAFPKKDGAFEVSGWYEGRVRLNDEKSRFVIEKMEMEMVMDGTAFVADVQDQPLGLNARLMVPISGPDSIDGFLICVSTGFQDQALKLAAVVAKLLGLALTRYRQIVGVGNAGYLGYRTWIGDSSESKAILSKAAKYALGDLPVVISGESGVGKELIARFLHEASDRKKGPFIPYNCATLNEKLAQSELFGHVKGAFTDAASDHDGLLAQADQGVLFLDEIGELPLNLQPQLLRAIETRSFRPVGAQTDVNSDFRVICATNRSLDRMARQGAFRKDLYYRLNVLNVDIPPLRERPADIRHLIDHFLSEAAARHGKNQPSLEKGCMERLAGYPWPGNVRELKNATERAVYTSGNTVLRFDDFGLPKDDGQVAANSAEEPLADAIADLERKMILEALSRCKWNKKKTAQSLQITRQTLDRKIILYTLDRQEK